ncbi:hypothetical protein VMCG_05921 [Cytospora schulzeri]|uniref:F-box domain-containing protein n=1 Tax=Cytospora schulzeri TaxID=448051 RepID=A0A423WD18_9PEZI|nr:hypothetical protein VMCG_05921 [Valsa malicola]
MLRTISAFALFVGAVFGASPKAPGFGQRPSPWIKHDVPGVFDNPTGLARPTFRYWVPDADVDDDVLYSDLKEMHDAGWGSVEIICLENYGIEPAVVDPAIYGYGGTKWAAKFNTMLRAADELNMTVDFALGPTQGASIPIMHPDTEGMNTELAYGQVNVSSGETFSGVLPSPSDTQPGYANDPEFKAPTQHFKNKFVAAVVARKSSVTATDPRVTRLDFDSVQNVTSLVKNGSISWTAPDDGNDYILFTFYQRRTGYLGAQGAFDNATDPSNPASWFAYVVDHFSQKGTDLWTGFTEQYVMNGENGDLLQQLGHYAWEDSAEFRATLFWTDKFLEYFNQSRGYDITPILPILFGTTGIPMSTLADGYFPYTFSDDFSTTELDWKLRNDYYQALQELYETYHLDGLSKWSSKWGLQGRVQPYATAPNRAPPWDMVSSAAHIDAPETESNYFDNVIDAFRAMSGGAMMGRKQIFSSELGADLMFSYALTWPHILNECAINYAGGVNRIVAHGYPYSGYRPDAEWPGLTTFEWSYSEMWGPRQPTWDYAREMGDWIARTQLVLQSGVPRVDIGIYRHKYISFEIKHYGIPENLFGDPSLLDAGYSYVSISPSLLNQDNAVITNGKLAEDGPGLSAFIVDNSTNLTTQAVTRFKEYAEQGFPVLFISGLPQKSPYYSPEDDEFVKQGVHDLLTYPSVKRLSSEAEVVAALKELGVAPAAENLSPCPILYVHRWDADNSVDYYWVYNSDINEPHATEASLSGKGTPYVLDAWTGEVAPILNYTAAGDRFKLWFDLKANQSTIVAFAPDDFFAGVTPPSAHVTDTEAEFLKFSPDANTLVARSTTNTTHTVALSDGRNHTFDSTSSLLPSSELGPWNLTVQDWQPGPEPKTNYSSVFTYHHVTLDNLIPWYNISGLEDTSGIGTYTTQFSWLPNNGTAGAFLDLGPVLNTIRLWVNNQWTGPIDVTDAVVDIGDYVVPGVNHVKIETASTLRNRLLDVNVTQSWEQGQYAAILVVMESSPALLQLPDELIDCIISQLATPADTAHFGLTCKHTQSLVSASLVWRRHCLATWKYWASRHDLPAKLAQPPLHTDWRQLYVKRIRIDREAAGLFESLLLTQQNRVQRMQGIAAKGNDVQDLLLKLKDETPDEAEDVLARRWHAEAILGMVHRRRAVDIWRRLTLDEDVSFEEALCGFDLFLLAVDRTDLVEDVKTELDRIATCVRDTTTEFDDLSIRQKAIHIAEYLISEGLVGNPDTANYHALQNNFLSIALFNEPHTSLPLQSVAIYCAVANRLGLDAKPSNVPGHVIAVVTAPAGQTLDGLETSSDSAERMHMDPWRQTQEVTPDELGLRLLQAGIPPYRHDEFISGADTLEMVLRTSRNMLRSVENARFGAPSQLDIEAAQYSSLWSMFALGDRNPALATARRRQCLHFLIEQVQLYYPQDSALFTENVLPLLEDEAEYDNVSEVVARMADEDRGQRTQKPRGADESGVQYRIGHYFQHKRFGYRGFIVGWDTHCAAGPAWIMRMGVDELPRGRGQPFYNIVADDRSSRYVAEENIELLDEQPPQELLRLAGRFFKRWDGAGKKFVSNISDEYPDD